MFDHEVSKDGITVTVTDIRPLENDYYTSFLDVYYPDGYRHSGYLDFFFDEEENDLGVSWGLYVDGIYDEDDNQYDSLPEHLQNINIEPFVNKLIDDILPEVKDDYALCTS